jgi:hypothetical protein
MFEDTKEVTRSRKSKKGRQHKIKNIKKERKKKEEHIQKKLLRHKLSINA